MVAVVVACSIQSTTSCSILSKLEECFFEVYLEVLVVVMIPTVKLSNVHHCDRSEVVGGGHCCRPSYPLLHHHPHQSELTQLEIELDSVGCRVEFGSFCC